MNYVVSLSPLAIDDLVAIHNWIEGEADWDTARAYVLRIRAHCDALNNFPHRGMSRDDLGKGIRTLSFERRIAILYRVGRRQVTIARILSVARELSGEIPPPG